MLPCIGLTSVASASNEQPLIRSRVHRIFKRIEGDMVGSVQLGDVFRQVPDGRTTRNERTACKRWALVHSWFAVLALSGNGGSLEFHLHLGRMCRLSFDVHMHASHGGSCFLFVSHTVQHATGSCFLFASILIDMQLKSSNSRMM